MEEGLPVSFRVVIRFGQEEEQSEDLEGEFWVCLSALSLIPRNEVYGILWRFVKTRLWVLRCFPLFFQYLSLCLWNLSWIKNPTKGVYWQERSGQAWFAHSAHPPLFVLASQTKSEMIEVISGLATEGENSQRIRKIVLRVRNQLSQDPLENFWFSPTDAA